jgi:hypothetical protein
VSSPTSQARKKKDRKKEGKRKEIEKNRNLKRAKADKSFCSAGVKSTITKGQLQAVKQAKKKAVRLLCAALSY